MTCSSYRFAAVGWISAGSVALWMASRAGATPPRYTVELVEPVPAYSSTFPRSINNAGAIAGYAADEPFSPLSIPIVIDANLQLLSLAQGADSFNFALGLNELGTAVGVSGFSPFIWVGDTGVPLAETPGFGSGSAIDINGSGTICGSIGDSDFVGAKPCTWFDATQPGTVLPGVFAGATNGTAWSINEAGQIAGTSGMQAFLFYGSRWDDTESVPLQIGPLPGGVNSEAIDMNEHGDVAGRTGFEDNTVEAMLYVDSTGELIGLGFLPGGGAYSFAWGVNNSRIVVGDANWNSQPRAFVWDGAMYDLSDRLVNPDSRIQYLSSAASINDTGQIAALAVLSDAPAPIYAIARLTPAIPGDMDGDRDVDLSDLTAFLANFGCTGTCGGDFDGDGDTDLNDLTALLSSFGTSP